MNAVYSIDLQKVNNVVDDLGDVRKSLAVSQNSLERIKNNLDRGEFKDIIDVLERLIERENYSEKVAALQNALREIVVEYTKAEEMLLKEKIDFNKVKPKNTGENDSSIWDKYKEGFWDNFLQELMSTLLTSGSYRLASLINMLSALAKGPDGPNSFVILDPSVANSTSKFLNTISKGLIAIGFAIDFGTQIAEGESLKDALIKSGAHLAIGATVGAIVGSVIPGPGTVAGAIAGLAIGAVVTYGANTLFDYIYDDPKGFLKDVENCWDKVTNVASNVADKVGDAVSSVSGALGTIFAV